MSNRRMGYLLINNGDIDEAYPSKSFTNRNQATMGHKTHLQMITHFP
jgi:hypothetical protein